MSELAPFPLTLALSPDSGREGSTGARVESTPSPPVRRERLG